MATLIGTNGAEVKVTPNDGKHFTLQEFYGLLSCVYVEWFTLKEGRTLIFDEDAKRKGLPRNLRATQLLHHAGGMPCDFIAGNALLVDRNEMRH